MSDLTMILDSAIASLGFAVMFQVRGRGLIWAALGGALTRGVLLWGIAHFDQRLVFVMLAAGFAAVYSELLGLKEGVPSTYFLYPTIIPLIPSDLIYYSMACIVNGNQEQAAYYGKECLLALIGMNIGFVLISIFHHYLRQHQNRKSGKV